MGMLLRLVDKMGWTGVGVEPSATIAGLATKYFHLNVYNCFLNQLPERERESFDIVALSDVFEHITEPIPFLHEAARYLKSDGLLYIKVPNARWNLFKQATLKMMDARRSRGSGTGTNTSCTTPTPRCGRCSIGPASK